ncbi:MAG: FG-GAP repeat protein [Alphaproteobacteria bacterium]|nr:FG-GAP repeat protein [Alphaproteobacteria bacterium]MCB9792082.1 FG-GAP repeat protein [Alphaproteobacteria bacterium]
MYARSWTILAALLAVGAGCADRCERYADLDEDGYGDPEAVTELACDEPLYPKESEEGGDCDDDNAAAYPGAEEVCDGVDNDCDGTVDEGVGESVPGYLDEDGDGVGGSTSAVGCPDTPGFSTETGDCDDGNEAIYPGADELCDDQDGDCDGVVDEEPVDGGSYWVDADFDEAGDPESPIAACGTSRGVADNGDDCDDSDPMTRPGRRELCDQADNDCDGSVDEGAPAIDWYEDGDEDGYGDGSGASVESCASPGDGYVDNGDDCDDSDPNISPAATEICMDGIDNDCSGDGAPCELSGDYDLEADADLVYLGAASSGEAAFLARSGVGDHDGDGQPELLVGAGAANRSAGQAFLLDLTLSGQQVMSTNLAEIDGADAGDELGVSVTWIGDHDRDGNDDIAVAAWKAAPNGSDSGEVYVFGGPVRGSGPGDADALITGSRRSDYFGTRVAGAGDLNGDNRADLIVGAYGEDSGGSGAGAAYIFYGPVGSGDAADADVKLTGASANDAAGYHVAGADLDGDGVRDVLVSAVEGDGNSNDSGVVYLVSGSGLTSGSLADATAISGGSSYDYFGWAAEDVGDVNCDGHNDLMVGAYAANSGVGRLYLFHGPIRQDTDVSAADHRFDGNNAGDSAGFSLSPAGDVNADGCGDLLIGAYQADAGGAENGVAYLFYGPVEGWHTLATPDARFLGTDRYDYAGSLVQDVGDADGDGVDDLAIGAFGAGSNDEGKLYVFLGGAP